MSTANVTVRLQCGWPAASKALRQLTLLTCALVLLWVSNILDTPSKMFAQTLARPAAATSSGPALLKRNDAIRTLTAIIGESVDILAIHNRRSTPYTEIVLWRSDQTNPGVLDPHEVAVLSHSRLFQTLTLYEAPGGGVSDQRTDAGVKVSSFQGDKGVQSLDTSTPRHLDTSTLDTSAFDTSALSSPRPGAAAGPGALAGQGLRLEKASVAANMMLDRTLASQPGFCDRWRGSPQVQPHLISAELSDLHIEACGHSGGGGGGELSVLRLSLRWAGESTDGAQEVSVLVKRIAHAGVEVSRFQGDKGAQ